MEVPGKDDGLAHRPPGRTPCEPWQAWLLHSFTASGVVAGLLALIAVVNRDAGAAISWLVVATVIDSVDGPIARSWDVATALPQINGCLLDAVVDFVTTVVVPLAIVWQWDLVPESLDVPVVGLALFTSALWFARTDMMSEDNWFNGFPAGWNLVVPTMYLLAGAGVVNALILTTLAVLQLTSVKFVHPVRVVEHRATTLAVTLGWLAAVAAFAPIGPDRLPTWGMAVLFVGPVYHVGITLRRNVGERVQQSASLAG